MLKGTAVFVVLSGLVLLVVGGCGGSSSAPSDPSPQSDRETGAVTTVSGSDRAGENQMSIEEFLRGQVPGLQVLPRPDGGMSLRIRGGSDAAEPLVVIDGAPVQPDQLSSVLESLNPSDISRVRVLRDVSSTARWGARGANGVLLITTKR